MTEPSRTLSFPTPGEWCRYNGLIAGDQVCQVVVVVGHWPFEVRVRWDDGSEAWVPTRQLSPLMQDEA